MFRFLLALWLGVALASPAMAHASLVSAEPADGAVLDSGPGMVRLRFNEPVAPAVIRLIDARGTNRDTAVHAHDEAIDIVLPPDLPRGTQTLSYRIISADGHPVGGSLLFSIGAATATAGAETQTPLALAIAIWVARVAFYIGLFAGVGGVFFQAWIAREPVARAFSARSLMLGAAGAIGTLGLQGLDLLGQPFGALLRFAPWQAAFATSLGWSVAVATAAFGFSAWAAPGGSMRLRRKLAAISMVGVGLSLAVTGHAASAEPHWLTRPAIFLHAIAVSYWIGALSPLLTMVRKRSPAILPTLDRFSRGALVAVSVLVMTGAIIAVLQLGAVSALYETAYGRILMVKLAAVLLLLGLAGLNRLRLTLSFAAGDHRAPWLARSILAEIVLMLMILALVAGWRFAPPPRAQVLAPRAEISLHIHRSNAMAQVTLQPGRVGMNAVAIGLLSGDFGPLKPIEVSIALSQPSAGIEPIIRRAKQGPDGQWQVDDFAIPVSGPWQIAITILITDFEEITLTDTLTVP